MTFLKWFSFVWIGLLTIFALYKEARDDSLLSFVLTLSIWIPVLIYIFLS